jgi:hypothetical protein
MHRPIGVTILALVAGLAALAQIWRAFVFMGIANFTFIGKEVSFPEPQWGQVFWAVVLAAIWFWVAAGFWNVRAYAWSFGNFIAMFTLVFGFMAVLFGSSVEAESTSWLLALIVLLYLNYAGVREQFVQHELALMTPEQRAAMEQMQAANQAAAAAMAAPAPAQAPAPIAAAPVAPAPAPAVTYAPASTAAQAPAAEPAAPLAPTDDNADQGSTTG